MSTCSVSGKSLAKEKEHTVVLISHRILASPRLLSASAHPKGRCSTSGRAGAQALPRFIGPRL